MEQLCGIYCIECIINHKKYIGQSIDINRRFTEHKSHLNCNKHNNKHLQYAWNQLGANNFNFYVLEICNQEFLDDRETYYINVLQTTNSEFGYNIEAGGHINKSLSDETKNKISNSLKGRLITDEHKERISESNRNRVISDETRKKIRENRPDMSGENNPRYGKHCSDETKAKISMANKNKPHPSGEDHHMYGKHHTEEAKKKISKAISGSKHPRCRPVYCVELDENFWGAKEVQDKYGINKDYICACCTGRQKSAGKHPVTGEPLHWCYTDSITRQNDLKME